MFLIGWITACFWFGYWYCVVYHPILGGAWRLCGLVDPCGLRFWKVYFCLFSRIFPHIFGLLYVGGGVKDGGRAVLNCACTMGGYFEWVLY